VFENGEFIGRYIYERKAHSLRLEGVSNGGIRKKTRSMVSDFYCEQRALGEWLMSADVTTALAQIHRLSPNLPAGVQLGSPDFSSE
jgi:hypothetical protein